MTYGDSMNDYVGKTVKRYSSLFTLPSHRKLLLWLFISCLLVGIFLITPLFPSYYGLALGSTLGIFLFLLTLSSDFVILFASLKKDPVFNMRRCSALSLYSLIFWSGLAFLGVIISVFFKSQNFYVKFVFLGFCVGFSLRFLVLSAVSFANFGKVLFYSIFQPILYFITILFIGLELGIYIIDASLLTFISLSAFTTLVAIFVFVAFLNHVGTKILGVGSFSALKAFVANWTEDLNAPLERLFERFGFERDIRVSALAFKANGRVKAMMIVPTFHSGPFRNVGSSALPYIIQSKLESRLNCVVSVPHGLSGHNLDLTSQTQNDRVIDEILKMVNFSNFDSAATPLVRIQRNGAEANCQIFGGCALVMLTLAPKTMEDLPPDIDSLIINEAEKLGLSMAIAVDAHDSIEGPFNLNEAINPLKKAAVISLEKASKRRRLSFEIGAAKIKPEDFSLSDGMGLGGITAIVAKVGDQRSAYITIDGNNMVSGLREKILSMFSDIGVKVGEVLTTDTHAVNGVVVTTRGYHPIGEVIDQEKLIEYVRQALVDALNNLEPAEVSWRTETISNVKVIGEKQVENMCMLVEKSAQRAKRLALSIFPAAGVILATLLMLF